MTTYNVITTEAAEGEIDAATEYLLLRSSNAARDFQDGMDKAILSLSEMPRRCPFAPEDGLLDRPVRQLIYRQGRTAYRILFTIFESEGEREAFVRVLRVRHGGQPPLGFSTDASDEN